MEELVIVLFIDVERSTEPSARHHDTMVRDLRHSLDELLGAQLARHQSQVTGTWGDGWYGAFTSSRRALACAVAIQRAVEEDVAWGPHHRVRVRVGLAAGELIEESGERYAATVAVAAHVCEQAQAGQILVTSAVRDLAGTVPGISFPDRGLVRLGAVTEHTHLNLVTWHRGASSGSGLRRPRLVGRDAELATLRGLMGRALGGHGAVVMLGGEPGVGKTRLVQEVAHEAAGRGMPVLTGHCDELAGPPPHGAFVEVIEAAARIIPSQPLREALGDGAAEVARMVPDLHRLFSDILAPVTLPAQRERPCLFNSVRAFVERACRTRPLLLVLEDLHWADEATLALLCHIAETVPAVPLLVLGTYRHARAGVALRHTVELLTGGQLCLQVDLRRLREPEVAALIGELTGREVPPPLGARLHAATAGNPYFVEEMVRHLVDEGELVDDEGRLRGDVAIDHRPVPELVRLVIGRRLARLGDHTRQVLTTAAMIGHFGPGLFETLPDTDRDAWLDALTEAEGAGLVIPVQGAAVHHRFAHQFVRQTLVAGTSLPRRQRLHLRIAEAMLPMDAQRPGAHTAEIAHHLLQAGELTDPERTVQYLLLATDRALSAAAFEEALHQARAALDLVPESRRHARAAVSEKVAHALRSLGRWEEALQAWRDAVAAHEDAADLESVGRVCCDMAVQLLWSGRLQEGLEVVNRGLTVLRDGRSLWRVQLLTVSGVCSSLLGSYELGDAQTRQAVELAKELGGSVLGAALVGRCAHDFHWGQLRAAVADGARGAEICRSLGEIWNVATGLACAQLALAALGSLDDVTRVGEELHPLAHRLGHHGALLSCGRSLSRLRAVAGDIDGFESAALDDLDRCEKTGMGWTVYSHIWLGVVAFWRGNWEKAVAEFMEAMRRERPESGDAGTAWAFRLLVLAHEADQREARTLLEGRREMLRSDPSRRPGVWTSPLVLPEALAALGAAREAAAFYPLASRAVSAGAVLRFGDCALIQAVAGICAAAREDWALAEGHYRTALRQADELPHRIAQPEVRRWLARMLRRRNAPGDRDEARELLAEAAIAYRRLGMPRHLRMVEALLAGDPAVRHP